MGQQYSTVGENAVATTAAERKICGENVDPGNGHLNPVWRKSVSSVVTSLPGHGGKLNSGDNSSSNRSKTEGDNSRMSIRAAIDSFIENCLSTPTEEAVPERSNADSSFAGESNHRTESSAPKATNLSADDNEKAQSGSLSLEDELKSSLKGEAKSSLKDLKDKAKSSVKDFKDEAKSSLTGLKDQAKSSVKGFKDEAKCSMKNLKDKTKSSSKGLKVAKSFVKDSKDEINNAIDKDVFTNCVVKEPSKDNGKDVTDKLKAEADKSCEGSQKEEVKERGDDKVNNIKNESIKDNSAEASNTSLEKQIQTSSRSEKQSFSAFLQDRLNRGDFDKHEELAQLALSKDIKCQEQMIMWEAVKKPVALSESSGTSYQSDGSLLTSGPVRLQTLIDRVLDSSLNNRSSATIIGNSSGLQVASAAPLVEDKVAGSILSRSSPSDQSNRTSSSEKNTSVPNDKRLSFKNHIEKVLIESFLSYEEDERKEALKKENITTGLSMKASSDSQTEVKECTISVQDLVDQVISQTQMSKLLTPSTRDTNRAALSLGQMDQAKSTIASGNESSVKPNAHSVSPQNTALMEAQRHMLQKEFQSSTSLGRKRGRPQLHATGSSSNSTTEPAKDPNSAHYSERVQEGKSGHPHTRISPLNYASKGLLPYGVSLNMAPVASHSAVAASATVVLQNRHYVAHSPKDLPSSMRTSLPSISMDHRLHPREPFHHQLENQHILSQAYQNRSHSHSGAFLPSSTAPPPLILAEHISSNQVVPVPHAPTKSCSCHACLNHFSQGQNHTAIAQNQIHHQRATQDKVGNPSNFTNYHPHLKSFKDLYPQQPSTVSEAVVSVLTAPVQSHPSVPITTQQNKHPSLPTPRDIPSAQHLHSHPLSTHHHHLHPSQPTVTLLDPKFPDTNFQESKPRLQFDTHGSDFQRLPGNRNPHPGKVEDLKVEAAAVYAQIGKESEQPLDLSVKPGAAGKQAKRTLTQECDSGINVNRQDVWDQGRTSPYRQSCLGQLPVSKTQSVVSEQGLPSGHHLQRLEKSVDKILPQGHSQLHDPRYIQHTHLPLHGVKIGSLPPAHETESVGRREGHHDLSLMESHDSGTSGHLSHSPNIYNQVIIETLPQQQQQQRQPMLAPPHNTRKLAPSPSHWTNRITSPDVSESQFDPSGAASPAVQQRPPSLGPELKQKVLPTSSAGSVSVSAHPQKSPPPEEADGQSFSISKHEPIQNIIGSHSPTDILYLICRLCRQTYGSPYGFRKHFRNQHGFEPKADHTIVQTISATKTAMAHTEPLHSPEETLMYASFKQEKLIDNSHSSKFQSEDGVTTVSSLINNPQPSEDNNLKKEMDTKFLECPECGQTFQLNDFGSYKRHCRQHNLHRSYGPFACHDCHKSFAEPQQLREHLLTHSSVTTSLCGVCHTFFSSPDHLAEHLHVSHGHKQGGEEVRTPPHLDSPERLADHAQTSERLADHAQTSERLADHAQTSQRLADHAQTSQRLADHAQTSERLADHAQTSQRLADHAQTSQRLADHAQISERIPQFGNQSSSPMKRSGSFSCQSETVSASSSSASPSSTKLSSLQTGAQESRHPSSSATCYLPTSKHYQWSKPSPADPPMFTVHTPKDLEVEKSPADGIVTSASPDSSFDDAKFQVGFQPASSTSQRSSRSTDAATTNGSDAINSDNQEQSSNSSHHGDKESASNSSDNDSKESTISFPPQKEESSGSLNSKTVKVSNSSLELDEANSFYRHKKYGRHWKRHSVSDGDGEPSTKSPKIEGASLVHRQSPYSVSSSFNYSVTVQDCQSSCPNLEESSLKLEKPNDEKGKKDLENQKAEDQPSHKFDNKQKSDKIEKSDLRKDIGKSCSSSVSDGASKFKWDRQTRSKAGKASNMVTHVP